jgi:hypothetical protein
MADLYGLSSGGGLTGAGATIDFNKKSVYDATAVDYYGNKPLTMFTIDFVAAVNTQTGANQAIDTVMKIIQKYATVVIRGALFDTNTQMCVAIETPNETADWGGPDDSIAATTLVEYIEDEIQALGDLTGETSAPIFDFSSVTLTVKTTFQLA